MKKYREITCVSMTISSIILSKHGTLISGNGLKMVNVDTSLLACLHNSRKLFPLKSIIHASMIGQRKMKMALDTDRIISELQKIHCLTNKG